MYLVKSYQRNIFFELLLMRASFIVLLFASVYLFFTPYADYSVLTIIGLITASVFSRTNICVFDDHVEIRRYYVSGMIPVKWTCTLNDRLDISSVMRKVGISASHSLIEPEFWILPTTFSDEKYYKISQLKIRRNGLRDIKIHEKLSNEEYGHLFSFYLKQTNANTP